jgi:hypothetical protein
VASEDRVPSRTSAFRRTASQSTKPGASEISSPSLMRTSSPSSRRSRKSAWRRFCRAWASKCEPQSSVASFSRGCGTGPVQAKYASRPASFLFGRSTGPSGPPSSKRAANNESLNFGRGTPLRSLSRMFDLHMRLAPATNSAVFTAQAQDVTPN